MISEKEEVQSIFILLFQTYTQEFRKYVDRDIVWQMTNIEMIIWKIYQMCWST